MQLVQRGAEVAAARICKLDVESLELERPRRWGWSALWAMEGWVWGDCWRGWGSTAGSGRWRWGRSSGGWRSRGPSWRWLCERSLGELLEVDFEAMSLMRLYRVSDALMAHRKAIEKHLFELTELFGLGHTVTPVRHQHVFRRRGQRPCPRHSGGTRKQLAQ